MTLDYIVQQFRYKIIQEYGCANTVVFSGVSIFISDGWEVLFPTLSIILFCPRIIRALLSERRELNAFLDSTSRPASAINRSGFYRLLWLGMLDLVVTFPLALSQIINSWLDQRMYFWQGWDVIHKTWTPLQVPKSTWDANFGGRFNVHLPQFFSPFVALVFFSIFGLSHEATYKYRWAWGKLKGFVRRKSIERSPSHDVEIAFKEGQSATFSSSTTSMTE